MNKQYGHSQEMHYNVPVHYTSSKKCLCIQMWVYVDTVSVYTVLHATFLFQFNTTKTLQSYRCFFIIHKCTLMYSKFWSIAFNYERGLLILSVPFWSIIMTLIILFNNFQTFSLYYLITNKSHVIFVVYSSNLLPTISNCEIIVLFLLCTLL